jgi:phosphatidylserine decarboxylase
MLHRSRAFLATYRFLPHRALNRAARLIAEVEPPAWALRAALAVWAKRAGIDLDEAEGAPYRTLQEFFLRALKAHARPLGDGFISPVDAHVMATGVVSDDHEIRIKGQSLSLARVVGGGERLDAFRNGTFAVLFLSPADYHHIHMPMAGRIVSVLSLAGRYFPQNEAALTHIARVHERNERALLTCMSARGEPFLLVLIGASLVGGIHLAGAPQSRWMQPHEATLDLVLERGERLGHFAFGSTVIVIVPRSYAPVAALAAGARVRLGETLFRRRDQGEPARPT